MKHLLHIPRKSIFAMAAIGLGLASPTFADTPYEKSDGSWINVSGTVVNPTDSAFTLDYGKGLIVVEMDDWDWYGDAKGLLDGDKVTVSGRIDDDFYETTTIEASSVWVEGLNAYFYANPVDEEDYGPKFLLPYANSYAANMGYTGVITSVDDREFTIDTGNRELEVDTSNMPYNPLDDKGYQQLKIGDIVQVNGVIDTNWLIDRELDATSIITLINEDRASSS